MKQMKQSGAFDCPIYLDNISCKRSNLGSRFHLAKKKAAGIVLRTPSRERRKYSTIWNPASLTGPWHLRPARHDYSH
jgi:hypothetical protein